MPEPGPSNPSNPPDPPDELDEAPSAPIPPTNYGAFVIATLKRATAASGTIKQKDIRDCLALAASYLVTDTSTNPEHGITTWDTGLTQLVDLILVLHKRGELQPDTVFAASKACSECWTAARNWRGLDLCQDRIRDLAKKLKGILDTNGRTYRGACFPSPI